MAKKKASPVIQPATSSPQIETIKELKALGVTKYSGPDSAGVHFEFEILPVAVAKIIAPVSQLPIKEEKEPEIDLDEKTFQTVYSGGRR